MPRKRTRVRTTTVTNTQIMLATLAAFLANGFALAALPVTKVNAKPPVISCKAEIIASARICQYRKNVAGFRSFSYRCPNGKTYNVSTSCRSRELMQKLANDNCEKRKDCAAVVAKPVTAPTPKAVTDQAPPVSPPVLKPSIKNIVSPSLGTIKLQQSLADIAFIGRPEENFTFYQAPDGQMKVKVRFTNRGPAVLPASAKVTGGTSLKLTFLNYMQQEIPGEPHVFQAELPSLTSGQSFEKVFIIDLSTYQRIAMGPLKYVRAELTVGNREVGATGIFDPDISNNTLIFDIPYKFPFPKGEDPL